MTVTYKEYMENKKAFFEKHKYDFATQTRDMDEYGRYHKTYSFSDGAEWYETMTPTYEIVVVEIKKAMVKLEVKMLRTEYWSTEAKSKSYYEKF